jgi:uncharacterized membrane protein YhhN
MMISLWPEDRAQRILARLAIFAAFLYLALLDLRPWPGDVVLKTAFCLVLAGLAWRAGRKLLALALGFASLGDALLGLDPQRLFTPGLAAFLVMQLLYFVIFLRRGPPGRPVFGRLLAMAVTGAAAIVYLALLWPRLGGLAVPVTIYVAAILAMALTAWAQPGLAIPAGATLFVISDALIAGGKFLALGPWTAQAIWATYALAQILIVLGLTTPKNQVDNPERHT